MTSTIKRRPRGYRTGISSEVFEFVMKLLRDTLGTTGRYLDLMHAPLRIQGPSAKWQLKGTGYYARQFYKVGSGFYPREMMSEMYTAWQTAPPNNRPRASYNVHWPLSSQIMEMEDQSEMYKARGSIVPFRHTYNATRII